MESIVHIAVVQGWTGWSIGVLVDCGDDPMPMHGGVLLTVTKMVHIAENLPCLHYFGWLWPSDGDDGDDGDLSKGGLVERSPENRNQREHEHGHAEEGSEHLMIGGNDMSRQQPRELALIDC